MSKKIIFLICASLIAVIIVICITGAPPSDKRNNYTLQWYQNESYLVDCTVYDNTTVGVEYAICFENHTDENITFSLGAEFKKSETAGWLKNMTYDGCDAKGAQLNYTIAANHKELVHFYFFGEYIGDSIQSTLSFPEKIYVAIK